MEIGQWLCLKSCKRELMEFITGVKHHRIYRCVSTSDQDFGVIVHDVPRL